MDALDDELAQQRVRAMVHERLFGSPAPPTIIGRYRVIRRLGVGAMGVVYAARDQALGRLVAVKVLHGHLDREGGEPRARLLREARALARLSHPNVVAVHEVGTHEGQVFLAMEYVAGPTLGAWIREARPPWRAIVQVFVQAGRGLQAAHAAGLVHRDFKPDNVLVDRTGRARVLDFGLVRPEEGRAAPITADGDELGPLTRSGAIVGTPAYMSPEQLRGEALDPRSDLFSFCVALHEALVGARPFDLYHEAGLREVAVGTTQEGAAPRLPRRLRRALDRGLARDRERRPPTMEPLLRELEGAATPALQRWEPRIGGALGVVALAALIGVGARADGAASRGAAVVPRIAHLRLVGEHARFRSADGAQSPKTRDRARLLAAERLLGSDPSAAAVVLAGLEAPDEVAARSSLGRLVDALLAEPLAESERWVRGDAEVVFAGDHLAYVLEDRQLSRLDLRGLDGLDGLAGLAGPSGVDGVAEPERHADELARPIRLGRRGAVALAIADDAAYVARADGSIERWPHDRADHERCASAGPAILDLQAHGAVAAWLRADGSVLIREAGGARLVTTIAGATALALSPGGHRLATRRGALVELLGGRALVRVQHPGARGHAIADSGALATAADGEVRIWSPAGKRIASVSLGAPVSHLEWSRGERLAIAAGDRVVVWEASRGPRVLRGGLGADRASERASDRASVLASGSGPNSASGSTSEPAPAQAAGSPAPTGQILALRWGDDDTLIAGLDDGCAQRWSLGRGHVDAILRRTRAAIVDLAVDDRTDVALTRSADGALRRWHLGDAGGVVLARRDREVAALAVHASGERRASGGADGRIDLWNGVLVARAGPRPPDHTIVCGEAIQAVALGATWLVGGDVSGRLCARRIADDGALEPAAIRSHITTRAITALAIDDAEHWLAVGDSDGGVQIVDLEAAAGRPRRWLPPRPGGSWIMSLSFETGSARLLAAAADGALTLGPADARPTRVGEGGEPGPRLRVAVWGPGPAAIVAGDDGWIRSIAIDHDTRGPGARIGHHPAAIWDLVVGPVVGGGGQGSGRAAWIASAGADGSILVWPPEPGERGLTLRGHRGEVLALARDPDDDHLLSAGEDGTVRRWPLALDDRLARLGDAAHVCVASAIVDELRTSGIVDGPPACPD